MHGTRARTHCNLFGNESLAGCYPPPASSCERRGGSTPKASGWGIFLALDTPHPRPLPTAPLRYAGEGESARTHLPRNNEGRNR